MAELESTAAWKETPQERALITVAILHRLFGGGDRNDRTLVEGMEQANRLITADLRARRQYDALVRIFREAQARDAEWCAECVAQAAAEGGNGPEIISFLQQNAERVRAGEGELDEAEWPRWLRTMREGLPDGSRRASPSDN